MKIVKLLLLTAMSFLAFSNVCMASCPEDTADHGQCDSVNVEKWWVDTLFTGGGPYFARVPIYITHDVAELATDSIAGVQFPLCYTHTNPSKYCSVSTYWNTTALSGASLPRSIFRHIVLAPGDTLHNWMLNLYEQNPQYEWCSIILNLDGTSYLWFLSAPCDEPLFGDEERALIATMTFKMQDTMHVCIDSCFWPPGNNLSFSRPNGQTWVPRDNMPYCFWVGSPQIRVTAPNGGEHWAVGSNQNITWLSENYSGASVKIDYSTNSGSSWLPVVGSTSNNGHYTWTIPNAPTTKGRVRVSDPGGTPNDISDADFTIEVPPQPDFTIRAEPDTQTVQAGYTADYNVVLTSLNGFASTCTLTVTGLPAGASPSFVPNPATPTDTSVLTVNTSAGVTPPGTYQLIITAAQLSKGLIQHSDSVFLKVTPAPDFTIDAKPDTHTVQAGNSVNYDVILTSLHGFASPCSLFITGLPAGASPSFVPNPATPTDTSVLTVNTSAGVTPPGTYQLIITAAQLSKGLIQHSDSVFLKVTPAPDFAIEVSPETLEVVQGNEGSYEVILTSLYGFSYPCTLTVSGIPQEASGQFNPIPLIPTDTSTLTITVAGTTHTGTYALTITGTEMTTKNQVAHSEQVFLVVIPRVPILSWSEKPGYLTDGVSPDTGLAGVLFTFRVVYSDPYNLPPLSGYPKVNIDLNGDGDFNDENEGSFTMGVVDADTNYANGREYFYNATLPASSVCQYSFSAKNSVGDSAIGQPNNLKAGPVILDPTSALDLYIYSSDIVFSDPHPDEGEVFTIFATVHNHSDSNLTNVSVSFYHSGELLNRVFIPNISAQSSATTSIQLSFATKGFYPIKVVIDEENSYQEWNELNNFAIRPVIVGDYQFPGGIVVNAQLNSPVYPYAWITVTGNAHYSPEYLGVVSGATVTITIQGTGTQYVTYTNDLGNFSIGFYGPSQAGDYTVNVEVTDYTLTGDTTLDLEVISQPGVDLAIRINLSEMDSLLQNEVDTLSTTIFNFGSQVAHDFWVGIYKDASLYYTYWVDSLSASDSLALPDTTVSFSSWGWHTVSAVVDVGDSVEEYNEGNNLSSFGFYVWCNAPDVHIIKLVFSDHQPKGQQPIDITAWVVNSGGVTVSQTFGVQFLDNGVPFDTGYINLLAPFDAETAYVVSDSFIYSDSIQHSFSVFADFQHVIAECNEGNNTYGGGPCIDLKTSYYDISFSDTDPQAGDTVRIIAKVFNLGNISAFNSQVRFKIDGIQVGQDVIIPHINPGGYETIYSSQVWQFNSSACSLVVQCDPANSIIECNEVNNSAYCPLPYDLYPYYVCRCPQEYPYAFPYVFSACATVVDSPVTIFGALSNAGGFDINGQVQIEVTDNIEGLLGIITVDSVLNHGSNVAWGDLQHAFANYGWHTVTLRADYNNQYYECGRESNNTYSASIFVDSLRPDLEVHSEYIQFSDDCPTWGDSIWFLVTIYNIGQAVAENVQVRFLVDELQIGTDILIDTIPVGPNNYHTDTSTAPWVVPEEFDVTHVCKVVVDPEEEIREIREDNNEATRALPVVRRGDVNEDCIVNLGDLVFLITYLYKNGHAPNCLAAGDVNCDGVVALGDVVYLISYQYKNGPPPSCK